MQEIFLQGQKLSTSGLLLETRLSYICYILHAKYFVQAILLMPVEMLLARTALSVGSTTQGRDLVSMSDLV
jgi:hypothetical protein